MISAGKEEMKAIGGQRQAIKDPHGGMLMRGVPMSMYESPPMDEVSLEEFELSAIDRQQGVNFHK